MSTQTASDSWLELDGAQLRWRSEGNGPALVLLHGWALDLDYWNPLAAALAQRFRLLRFDRRGFGLSAGLPDIHRNVGDLQAVLQAAGEQRAALVGMSQGARLALHFARRFPARVRGLVLDGAPAVESEPELPLARYRGLLESEGLAALREDILRHPLMQLQTTDAAARRLLADMLARYRGLDLVNAATRAAPPELRRIAAPTLVINGALDSPERLAAGEKLQATLPHARRIVLPAAGHLALLDDPSGYVQALDSFCEALPP